jgi:hypothetical protein
MAKSQKNSEYSYTFFLVFGLAHLAKSAPSVMYSPSISRESFGKIEQKNMYSLSVKRCQRQENL